MSNPWRAPGTLGMLGVLCMLACNHAPTAPTAPANSILGTWVEISSDYETTKPNTYISDVLDLSSNGQFTETATSFELGVDTFTDAFNYYGMYTAKGPTLELNYANAPERTGTVANDTLVLSWNLGRSTFVRPP